MTGGRGCGGHEMHEGGRRRPNDRRRRVSQVRKETRPRGAAAGRNGGLKCKISKILLNLYSIANDNFTLLDGWLDLLYYILPRGSIMHHKRPLSEINFVASHA